MNEQRRPTPPRGCPLCGAPVRIVRNPYFGVGLAVHRHFSSCRRCGYVEFLPSTRVFGEEQTPVESPREPLRWWTRLAILLRTIPRLR